MSLEDRKEQLRKEIERKERYLASLEAMPDFEVLVNGSVVALTITYGASRTYVVIGYKAQGDWFLTGEKSPRRISSEGLAEWLMSQGRRLNQAMVIAEVVEVQTDLFDIGEAMLAAMGARRRGTDWRDQAAQTLNNYGYGEE